MATTCPIAPQTRLKIHNIAVLTDFSANATAALRFAGAFARGYNASLVLAHAYIPPYIAFAAPETGMVYEAFRDLQANLEARLIAQADSDFLRGLKCTTFVREGTPRELVEELRDVDLIVVGTSGETGLEKVALGSTAETILRSSQVPVLTVGPHCQGTDATDFAIKSVLYATDFSAGADIALPYAFSIASEHNAELVLLHVSGDKEAQFSFERTIASTAHLDKLHVLVADEICKLVADGSQLRCKPTCAVAFGRAQEVIVHEAKNRHADIVVIGARGGGVFSSALSHFGGGTAYHVVAHSECPVLTICRH